MSLEPPQPPPRAPAGPCQRLASLPSEEPPNLPAPVSPTPTAHSDHHINPQSGDSLCLSPEPSMAPTAPSTGQTTRLIGQSPILLGTSALPERPVAPGPTFFKPPPLSPACLGLGPPCCSQQPSRTTSAHPSSSPTAPLPHRRQVKASRGMVGLPSSLAGAGWGWGLCAQGPVGQGIRDCASWDWEWGSSEGEAAPSELSLKDKACSPGGPGAVGAAGGRQSRRQGQAPAWCRQRGSRATCGVPSLHPPVAAQSLLGEVGEVGIWEMRVRGGMSGFWEAEGGSGFCQVLVESMRAGHSVGLRTGRWGAPSLTALSPQAPRSH